MVTLSYSEDDASLDGASQRAPQLYLVLGAVAPKQESVRFPLQHVDTVRLGRGEDQLSWSLIDKHTLEVQIPDDYMSSEHAELCRVGGRWAVSDRDSRNGVRVNGQQTPRAVLEDGDLLELGRTFFLFKLQPPLNDRLDAQPASALTPPTSQLRTFAPALINAFMAMERIAPRGLPVMVLGESGTGKEVVARALHECSERSGAFIPVNCGAIAEGLIESELFGAQRGAFSGADQDRPGLIRAADKGTLFLDELGDLPLASQVAFLRVLEQREVTPVGGTTPVSVDFRLVTATHKDLEASVASGDFRQDLHARICGLTIDLPPLRERTEDMGMLIWRLLTDLYPDRAHLLGFTNKAARALLMHSWPQNVRGLRRALELAAALAPGDRIDLEHLPPDVRGALEQPVATPEEPAPLNEEQLTQRAQLIELLEKYQGNVTRVSEAMGVARMQIHRWLKRYSINARDYRAK